MAEPVPDFVVNSEARRRAHYRHPWLFKDHVVEGQAEGGAIVRVVDSSGKQLGFAAWSPQSRIALRFLRFGSHAQFPDRDALAADLAAAIARRAPLADVTDALRLVSSEADGFPGLIVDRYGPAIAVAALSVFADRLLPDLTEWLRALPGVECIVARNDASVRRLEGLPLEVKTLAGEPPEQVEIHEAGVRFTVDLQRGQKTGFFLDQRKNRLRAAAAIEPGASVLDAFCYTGGFALHAARRAGSVLALDDSKHAVEVAARNAEVNGLANVTCERANAFDRLRELDKEGRRFDAIVLDPPAFAKNRNEREAALRGYREINSRALRLLSRGGLLVSASCSYHVDESSFEHMLREAAADAQRSLTLIERGQQDLDHPVLLGLPESRYLKCCFLRAD